jgi:hypothetical protein
MAKRKEKKVKLRPQKEIEKMLVCVSDDMGNHIVNEHGKGRADIKCPICEESYGKMYILQWMLGIKD